MTRTKVTLEKIENESARKAAYRKRKEGLCKKLEELCILCDIKACIIIYSPDYEGPFVWPSSEEAEKLVTRFEKMPKIDQARKMVSHEEYMQSRLEKLRVEVNKQEIKNKKMEASIIMHKITHGSMMVADIEELREARLLSWFAEEKLREIRRHKLLFPPLPPSPSATLAPAPTPLSLFVGPSISANRGEGEMQYHMEANNNPTDPFFMDMMNYASTSTDVASTSGKGK